MTRYIYRLYLLLGSLLCAWVVVPALAQETGHTGTASPPEFSKTVTIPMRYDPPRIIAPLIRVSINGAKPENFILDTGAGYPLIVTDSYVRRAKLPRIKAQQVVNNAIKVPFAQVDKVEIEANELKLPMNGAKRALVIDTPVEALAPGENVVGIIGVALLAQTPAQMDFDKQTITLYMPSAFAPPAIPPFPLNPSGSGTYNTRITIAPDLPVTFLIDTGATNGQLDQATLDKLSKSATKTTVSAQVQGLYLTETAKVRAISIGSATEQDTFFDGIPSQMDRGIKAPLLGMAVLQNYRVTFDIPHKRLYMEPNPDLKFRLPVGESGATLVDDGTQIRVKSLSPKSPADEAGLQEGDAVVAIDEITTDGEPVYALQRVLNGIAGVEARVDVQRGDTKQTVRFTRGKASAFADKAYAVVEGVVGRTMTGKSLEIFSLKPNSPLYAAGVRAGDTILRINGQELATLTIQQKIPLLRQNQATLVVKSNDGQERTVQVNSPVVTSKEGA